VKTRIGNLILIKKDFEEFVVEALEELKTQGEGIMATQQELSDKLDAIPPVLDAIVADEQALKDQIAALTAGQPVTQEQLDAMTAKVDGVLSRLQGIDASV